MVKNRRRVGFMPKGRITIKKMKNGNSMKGYHININGKLFDVKPDKRSAISGVN